MGTHTAGMVFTIHTEDRNVARKNYPPKTTSYYGSTLWILQ